MALPGKEQLEGISALTVIELKELLDAFEEKFGVTAATPVPVTASSGAASTEEDDFDVILAAAGAQKIQVIKVVRELTGLGLKEAKDLVDAAPRPVLQRVTRTVAERAEAQLAEAGASADAWHVTRPGPSGRREFSPKVAEQLRALAQAREGQRVVASSFGSGPATTVATLLPWATSDQQANAAQLIGDCVNTAAGRRPLDLDKIRAVARQVAVVVGRPPAGPVPLP